MIGFGPKNLQSHVLSYFLLTLLYNIRSQLNAHLVPLSFLTPFPSLSSPLLLTSLCFCLSLFPTCPYAHPNSYLLFFPFLPYPDSSSPHHFSHIHYLPFLYTLLPSLFSIPKSMVLKVYVLYKNIFIQWINILIFPGGISSPNHLLCRGRIIVYQQEMRISTVMKMGIVNWSSLWQPGIHTTSYFLCGCQ